MVVEEIFKNCKKIPKCFYEFLESCEMPGDGQGAKYHYQLIPS